MQAAKNKTMEHRRQQVNNKPEDLTVERRFATSGLELRKSDSGSAMLRGYALRFNSTYDMGWFTEEVDARALDGADMSDVRILFNHDPNQILGRTAANTARVGVDSTGMWYEVDLPDSPNGENARAAIERGDVSQSSWGFSLLRDESGRSIGDKWEVRDGKKHRTLTLIDTVFDASPVVYPANPDTTIAKRSFEAVEVIEKRDDGEDMGEGVAMPVSITEGEAASTWELSWMMSNVAWATYRGNEIVSGLNAWIADYGYYAGQSLKEAPVFADLEAKSREAKTAIVALIDSHIDALKTLNNAENRGLAPVEDTETNTIDIAELEEFELRRMQLLH